VGRIRGHAHWDRKETHGRKPKRYRKKKDEEEWFELALCDMARRRAKS
jgi:hypothetical protein